MEKTMETRLQSAKTPRIPTGTAISDAWQTAIHLAVDATASPQRLLQG
jgi:hypothetical protein